VGSFEENGAIPHAAARSGFFSTRPASLMNLVKKILIGHSDPKVRRRLVLLLADAGFDVRAFGTADAAAENARGEWFDLAVVATDLPDAPGFSFVDRLKQLQPTVPVLLLVSQLELPLVVQGIRLGVADIVALADDPRVLLQRIEGIFNPGTAPAMIESVTPEDLAQVESLLEKLPFGSGHSAHPYGLHINEPHADLLQVSKEKAILEARFDRLQREKAALGAELKTLLAQGADATRLQAELDELRTGREFAAATQAAIDEKARELAETRAAIASERSALDAERRQLAAGAPASARGEEMEKARAELTAWRERLGEEEDRLAAEATSFRQEVTQFNQQHRQWQEDLDLLRAQEENLRTYEERLRGIQSQLEADRVMWSSTAGRPVTLAPFTDDAAVREAWTKLQRATELFEAEQANVCDERNALREHTKAVKHREEAVRDREIQLALYEKQLQAQLNEAPPPAPPPSTIQSLTRAPYAMARALFNSEKKA
jgi:DNA-binding NarL/FixJ family response regulator